MKTLKTEEEYLNALAYVESLMDAAEGSHEEEELREYSLLVENYEREHYWNCVENNERGPHFYSV